MKIRLSFLTMASASLLGGVLSAASLPSKTPRDPALVPAVPEAAPEARAENAVPTSGSWRDQVCFDVERDGTIWARGATYKASFGPGGATYYPFFGAEAPRNFPVELSLASARAGGAEIALAPATSASRDGMRIVIDRGPIDEVYELALDRVEQTFVIESRPAGGSIRLVVDLQSELTRNATSDGIELANEWGTVRYGNAFVREASGARVPLMSCLVEHGVEIEITDDYLAAAEFPLTIDPVVMTFPVGSPTLNESDPSVAYDVTTDRYLVVYDYSFSAFDSDMVAEAYNSSGTLAAFRTIDFSTDSWYFASCANLNKNDQFLCAASLQAIPTPTQVWGRTLTGATLVAGDKFLIASAASNLQYVSAGGDPYDGPASAFYCVVWMDNDGSKIQARLVTSSSTLVGFVATHLNPGTSAGAPYISKSNGQLVNDAAWTIGWDQALPTSAGVVMRLRWNGDVMTPPAAILPGYLAGASVSTPLLDGRTLLVWQELSASPADLYYSLLDGTTVQSTGNLTTLENLSTQVLQQETARVDSDGQRFAVSYVEVFNGEGRVWISSFAPIGTSLDVIESHLSLDLVGNSSFTAMDIASNASSGGTGTRYFVGWDNQGAIRGAFYDRPQGGSYRVFCTGELSSACPCGNFGNAGHGCANSIHPSGALLAASGTAQLGADTLTFTLSSVPVNSQATLFQGTSTLGSFFGDGLLCTAGGLLRLGTKSTGASATASWPTGSDAPISVMGMVPSMGARRYYQVTYRNSAPFCTNATFNISNGMSVLWLP